MMELKITRKQYIALKIFSLAGLLVSVGCLFYNFLSGKIFTVETVDVPTWNWTAYQQGITETVSHTVTRFSADGQVIFNWCITSTVICIILVFLVDYLYRRYGA